MLSISTFCFHFLQNFVVAQMFVPWYAQHIYIEPHFYCLVSSSSVIRFPRIHCSIARLIYNNSVFYFLRIFPVSLLSFANVSFSILMRFSIAVFHFPPSVKTFHRYFNGCNCLILLSVICNF